MIWITAKRKWWERLFGLRRPTIVRNCKAHDNPTSGIWIDASGSGAVFENNKVCNCKPAPIGGNEY